MSIDERQLSRTSPAHGFGQQSLVLKLSRLSCLVVGLFFLLASCSNGSLMESSHAAETDEPVLYELDEAEGIVDEAEGIVDEAEGIVDEAEGIIDEAEGIVDEQDDLEKKETEIAQEEVKPLPTPPSPDPQALAKGGSTWTQIGGNPAQQGLAEVAGPTKERLKWSYLLKHGWGTSVVLDNAGNAYFADVLEEKGRLISVDGKGKERWTRELGNVTSPVVLRNGTVVIAKRQAGKDSLLALDANGRVQWKRSIKGTEVLTEIVVDEADHLYIGTADGDGDWNKRPCSLHAFTDTGKPLWSKRVTNAGYLATPAIHGNRIFLGGDELRALDATSGKVAWSYPVETLFGSFGPVYHPKGFIVVGSAGWASKNKNVLYAISTTGKKMWSLKTGFLEMTPAIAPDGSVIFHSWPDDDKKRLQSGLFAVHADGTVKWELRDFIKNDTSDPDITTPIGGSDSSPIVDSKGTTYFGADNGAIYAVDKNGRLVMDFQIGFEWDNRPALGPDGTLYIANSGSPGKTRVIAISDLGTMRAKDPWLNW